MSAVPRRMGVGTAALLVVACMIGTGVFGTSGYLVRDLGSSSAVLLAWALGGASALCGALAYAEVAAAIPDNGGEYRLLGRIWHPAVGFTAGVVSVVVGFAAPLAAACIAMADYLAAAFPGTPRTGVALAVVLGLSAVHAARVGVGNSLQDAVTVAKVLLIGAFAVAGLALTGVGHLADPPAQGLAAATFTPGFAIGLVYVSYAYSGWNAAAYVAGEVRNPGRNVPLALLAGTFAVTALYMGLNAMFLASAHLTALSGIPTVADVAAGRLFGDDVRRGISALISLGLFSTAGAFVIAGGRVLETMGRDHPRLGFLATRPEGAGPVVALALQAGLAVILVLTTTYDLLVTYAGVLLGVSDALTVAGVFVLRWREPGLARPYLAWGHPWTTLFHLLVAGWMIVFALWDLPAVALASAVTIGVGLGLYALSGPEPVTT